MLFVIVQQDPDHRFALAAPEFAAYGLSKAAFLVDQRDHQHCTERKEECQRRPTFKARNCQGGCGQPDRHTGNMKDADAGAAAIGHEDAAINGSPRDAEEGSAAGIGNRCQQGEQHHPSDAGGALSCNHQFPPAVERIQRRAHRVEIAHEENGQCEQCNLRPRQQRQSEAVCWIVKHPSDYQGGNQRRNQKNTEAAFEVAESAAQCELARRRRDAVSRSLHDSRTPAQAFGG